MITSLLILSYYFISYISNDFRNYISNFIEFKTKPSPCTASAQDFRPRFFGHEHCWSINRGLTISMTIPVQCTIHCALWILYYFHDNTCTVHCALCSVHFVLLPWQYLHCALYTVHCELFHNNTCTVHSAQCQHAHRALKPSPSISQELKQKLNHKNQYNIWW